MTIPTPAVPIPEEDWSLFQSVNVFVYDYMSQAGHDSSHDYLHILRVVSNANILLNAELKAASNRSYDISAIFLAALLHDVGDHKYVEAGKDVENQISQILLERGASTELASKVQLIAKHVGFTNEKKNPASITEVLMKHPELAIVQDADRLDAIGAIGVGRCFTFGGAKYPEQPMSRAIDHFAEKLYTLAGMMKTDAGREMAESRTRILKDFATQFNEESKLSYALK